MRRLLVIVLALVCVLSLASCGSQEPSLDEVEQAIENGSLTIADADRKSVV